MIREGIRTDVGNVILISGLVLAALLALYLLVSGVITASITKPLQKLREATRLAGREILPSGLRNTKGRPSYRLLRDRRMSLPY